MRTDTFPTDPTHVCTLPVQRVLSRHADALVAVVAGPAGRLAVARVRSAGGSELIRDQRLRRARREHEALLSLPLAGVPEPICLLKSESLVGNLVEYIQGSALNELPASQVWTAFESLLGLVSNVHRIGWVHGDIKPENVLWDAGAGSVSLIDWEHSGQVGDDAEPGTVGFAPPQSWRSGFRADPATDVFSLAVSAICLADSGDGGAIGDLIDRMHYDPEAALSGVPNHIRTELVRSLERGRVARAAGTDAHLNPARAEVWLATTSSGIRDRGLPAADAKSAIATISPATPCEMSARALSAAVANAVCAEHSRTALPGSWCGLDARGLAEASGSGARRDELVRRARRACEFLETLDNPVLVLVSDPARPLETAVARLVKTVTRSHSGVRCIEVIPRVKALPESRWSVFRDRVRHVILGGMPVPMLVHGDDASSKSLAAVAFVRYALGQGRSRHGERPPIVGGDGARREAEATLLREVDVLECAASIGDSSAGVVALRRATTLARATRNRDGNLWCRIGVSAGELGRNEDAIRLLDVAGMLGASEVRVELARLHYVLGNFASVVQAVAPAVLVERGTIAERSWLNLALARSTSLSLVWRAGRKLLAEARGAESTSVGLVLRHLAVIARYRRRDHTATRLVREAIHDARRACAIRTEMELLAALDLARPTESHPNADATRWEAHRDQCIDLGLRDLAVMHTVRAARSWSAVGEWESARFALDACIPDHGTVGEYWANEYWVLTCAARWHAGLIGAEGEVKRLGNELYSRVGAWPRLGGLLIDCLCGTLDVTHLHRELSSAGWIACRLDDPVHWVSSIRRIATEPARSMQSLSCLRPFVIRLLVHGALSAGIPPADLWEGLCAAKCASEVGPVFVAASLYEAMPVVCVEIGDAGRRPPGVFPWEWEIVRALQVSQSGGKAEVDQHLDAALSKARDFSSSLDTEDATGFASALLSQWAGTWGRDSVAEDLRAPEVLIEAHRAKVGQCNDQRSVDAEDLSEVSGCIGVAANDSDSMLNYLAKAGWAMGRGIGAAVAYVVREDGVTLRVSDDGLDLSTDKVGAWVSGLVISRARHQRDALVVADALSEEVYRGRRSVRVSGARSILVLPIPVESEWWGLYFAIEDESADAARRASRWSDVLLPLVCTGAALVAERCSGARTGEELSRLRAQRARDQELVGLGQATGALAHELNNLLSVVGGEAQFVSERLTRACSSGLLESVDAILQSASDAGDLVRNVLDCARLEPATRDAPVALDGVVRDVSRSIGHTCPDLRIEQRGAPGVLVHGNPVELREILTNLLRNAADAMDGSGDIVIDVRRDYDLCSVRIRDEGPGLSNEALDKLFDPFFSTKGKSGNGMGLTIVRKLVAAHGGRVSLRNYSGGAEAEIVLRAYCVEAAERKSQLGSCSAKPNVADL